MSVSLIVSPLCRVRHLNVKEIPSFSEVQSPIPGVQVSVMPWAEVEKHLHTFPKSEVLKWMQVLARKYQSQLGELLAWDENTSFEESEDFGGELGMLTYVAACVDLLGEPEAARKLLGQTGFPLADEAEFFKTAAARGYLSKFPQLLLGVDCWLTFRRDMIIEEPNLLGATQRFGSLFSLRLHIETIRTFILNAEPSAVQTSGILADGKWSVLQKAWQCAVTMSRLTTDAIAHRVPMTLSE